MTALRRTRARARLRARVREADMGRSLAILGVPGVLDGGGAADTSFSMTVTTTGAQQLKLGDDSPR